MMRFARLLVPLLAACASPSAQTPESPFVSGAGEKIVCANVLRNEGTGAFVDGRFGGLTPANPVAFVDRAFSSPGSVIHLPALQHGRGDEVVVFSRERPPVSAPANWSLSLALNVSFPSRIELGVTVWNVYGGGPTAAKAVADLAVTNYLLSKERMGVVLTDWQFKSPEAPADRYRAFAPAFAQQMVDAVGFDSGRLNVYYVERVQGDNGTLSGGNGQTTVVSDSVLGTDAKIIALGRWTVPELLCHELGHVFGLTHTDEWDAAAPDGEGGYFWLANEFGVQNIMCSYGVSRLYFTEGQTYRAHFGKESHLNKYFKARGDRPQYPVHDAFPFGPCPALNRRIWADGTRGPN